ncbi:HNH endonuclease [Corynebacterium accolens]|uniref:HNH endonuclease n=1 Tax=Corynebacterium accolens TaxID=38284 RepID=UPI0032B80F40
MWLVAKWSGRYAQRLVKATIARHGDVCHLCGHRGATTADHVVPRSRGGDDSLDNLRPAHASCNSSRGNMPIDEWHRRHPKKSNRVAPSRDW